ncbi:FxsA family protein [Shimia biformata]|uniref:FxsA family protein n=1 Tax=Shimia biformata TaxID=1294299 RepID=UPI00194E2BF2|nr:FxsA family protein [Shimia biformata]
MWLLLAFIAVPMIEIALFIQVGDIIGLWPTLFIVLFTAVLGTWLVRTQGRMAIGNLQRSFNELNDPTEPLAHGAMILIAGALLLTPGFFTDAVGFALLFPPFRVAVFRYLRSRVTVQSFSMGENRATYRREPRADVIDGEFSEVDPAKKPTHTPSGWTKH